MCELLAVTPPHILTDSPVGYTSLNRGKQSISLIIPNLLAAIYIQTLE